MEASRSVKAEMAGMAKSMVIGLGLLGSNGVDFMLTKEGPVVVEVNPRFREAWTRWSCPRMRTSLKPT